MTTQKLILIFLLANVLLCTDLHASRVDSNTGKIQGHLHLDKT